MSLPFPPLLRLGMEEPHSSLVDTQDFLRVSKALHQIINKDHSLTTQTLWTVSQPLWVLRLSILSHLESSP